MSELTPLQKVPGSSPLIEIHISISDADAAHALAKEIVAAHLAACVQCLGPMTSVYSWKGEVHQATEWLLVAKTTAETFQALSDMVTANHRYDIPEIIAIPVSHALGPYGAWVRDAVLDPALS